NEINHKIKSPACRFGRRFRFYSVRRLILDGKEKSLIDVDDIFRLDEAKKLARLVEVVFDPAESFGEADENIASYFVTPKHFKGNGIFLTQGHQVVHFEICPDL